MAGLSMRDIRKAFAGKQVLHGVDFDVRPGEVHGLVGHNGAGKSTLMKVLSGIYDDYRGAVTLDETPLDLRSPPQSLAAGIAVIHQEFALVPQFTVAQNIALGAEPRRRWPGLIDHARIRRDGAELLDRLGYALPLDVPVGRLSVSAQQLTEIARAVGRQARFVVMDEPTARLPRAERALLFEVIRQLTGRGVGIVYISHFLDETLAITDRITVLRDGAVVTTAPATDLDLHTLTGHIMGHQPAAAAALAPDVPSGAAEILRLGDFAPRGRAGSTVSLHRGEIVGLAGLTGSGRTGLALAITGAIPSTGELLLDGRPQRFGEPADAAAAGIALVPEDRKTQGLVMTASIADNVLLGAPASGTSRQGIVNRAARQRFATDAIERFGIRPADPTRLVADLSGGNQQKVLLARAAVRGAKVLVLDQPTAGVDIGAKQEIYRIIRQLAADGAGCLVISDELAELIELCHRVAIVSGGRITGERPTAGVSEADLLAAISVKEPV